MTQEKPATPPDATPHAAPGATPEARPATTPEVTPGAPHPEFEAALANLPTWEDDETVATRLLRALAVLFAGGLLLWGQWHTPYSPPGEHWGRWVLNALVSNFLLPLGVVWMFFGQGLRHQDWLKDQRNNAWDYGWKWSNWKRALLFSLGATLLLAPFMWFAAREPGVAEAYVRYLPPTPSLQAWLLLWGGLALYLFCWEWFFRGFLLFGMAQGLGAIPAILLQATFFGLAHWNKPPLEVASSFVGGLILGVWCWREKSFLPAFLTHLFVHALWVLFIR